MSNKLNQDLWKQFEDEGTVIEIDVPDFEEVVDNKFVKSLRTDLGLTQKVFGDVLGVAKKTIEKWEQGSNPIKGTAARLLYLINDDYDLVNKLYSVNIIKNLDSFENEGYTVKQITPLIENQSNRVYQLSDKADHKNKYKFDSNQFEVELGGESRWMKKSEDQLFTS